MTPEKSLHEDVCISFSEGQWVTQEPGFYRVQAFCQVGETVLASRPLTIFVRYPNRRTENHIVPLLNEEVATYLALEGGPHLTAAVAGLGQLEQEMPEHPLVSYFRLYRCLDQGTGFKRYDRGKARVVEATPPRPEYKAYVGVIAPQGSPGKAGRKATGASADATTAPSPFSNVYLDKIGRRLHATLAVADPSDAKKYLKVLAETLQGKRRRVPREKLLAASEVYSATLKGKKR